MKLSIKPCKKLTAIHKGVFSLLILALLSLTACMPSEERELARKNEALAQPIAQQYLDLNYGGGEIQSAKCLLLPRKEKVIPDFNDYASSFVDVSVTSGNQSFSIVVNVETGQCYDNSSRQLLEDGFKKHIKAALTIDEPYEIQIDYYLKDVQGEVRVESLKNYTESGISSVEQLLQDDKYRVYAVCTYVESDMDFKSVDVEPFFPDLQLSQVYLALVNFRSQDRFVSSDKTSFDQFVFDGVDNYYRLSDVVIAEKEKGYDIQTQKLVYDDTVRQSYASYRSEVINGIEFIWDETTCDLDFEVVPAEKQIKLKPESEATYYATDDKAVRISSTMLVEDYGDINNDVYFYFDKGLYNKEIIITDKHDSRPKYRLWTLNLKKDDYVYQNIGVYDQDSITLGFYEKQ